MRLPPQTPLGVLDPNPPPFIKIKPVESTGFIFIMGKVLGTQFPAGAWGKAPTSPLSLLIVQLVALLLLALLDVGHQQRQQGKT